MLCEKASLEEHVARLDREVNRLTDRVGALTLENTGLSERTVELESDLVGESAARGVLEKDIAWVLCDGRCRIVDKLIESPEFLKGLMQVQVACLAAGME